MKIVLVVVAVAAVAIAIAVGAFSGWVNANQAKWQAAADSAKKEGQRFGAGKDEGACTDGALARAQACANKGVIEKGTCYAMVNIFNEQCRLAARPDARVCARVPAEGGVMKLLRYAQDECDSRGQADEEPCLKVMSGQAQLCARSREGAPVVE